MTDEQNRAIIEASIALSEAIKGIDGVPGNGCYICHKICTRWTGAIPPHDGSCLHCFARNMAYDGAEREVLHDRFYWRGGWRAWNYAKQFMCRTDDDGECPLCHVKKDGDSITHSAECPAEKLLSIIREAQAENAEEEYAT